MSNGPQDPPLPPPIDQPRSGGRSGFRILLYVLVGIGGLLVLTCGAAVFFAWQNPAFRETLEAAMNAQSAPGAEALRAAGCREAAVMDVSSALEAIASQKGGDLPEGVPTLYVTCQLAEGASLDCDGAAAAYIGEVGEAAQRFVAQVASGLAGRPECQVVYEPDGTRVGTLEEVARSTGEAPPS